MSPYLRAPSQALPLHVAWRPCEQTPSEPACGFPPHLRGTWRVGTAYRRLWPDSVSLAGTMLPALPAGPGARGLAAFTATPGSAPPAAAPGSSLWPFLFFAVTQTETPAHQKERTTTHTVKLRGAPFNVTEVRASNGTG